MTDGEGLVPLAGSPSGHGNESHAGKGGGDGGPVAVATRTAPEAPPESRAETETGTATDAAAVVVTDAAEPAPAPRHARLPYNPALDGIRGLAVGAVLLFHGGFTWARGGFLGVSTFFTLSGFLITSLVVGEFAQRGRIHLTAFWARRLRRLFPAASLTLVAVSVSALRTDEVWERGLRADVIAAALNVANWRFLFADVSYAERFASPSPVLHFWSLAIEEQFYWLFPLLAAGVLGLAKGSLRVFGGVLAGLLAVSAALTFLSSDTPDTVYYSTPIRMGEILVGALLALLVARGALVESRRLAPVLVVGGALALAASLWAWWNVEEATRALYEGGLLAYAGVSGLLVLAACVPGPVHWLLSFEPLRLLGVISYGVYLIHWPVFLWLDEGRADRLLEPLEVQPRGAALFALRLAVTLAAAIASHHLLEQPIRRGRRPRLVAAPLLAGGTVATVLLVAVVVPRVSPPPADPFRQYLEAADGPDPAALTTETRIGVTIGDSTMLRTAWGLSVWGNENRRLVLAGGTANVGCGIGRGGDVEYSGERSPLPEPCQRWAETVGDHITRARDRYGHVDFVVVQTGPWDVANRRLEGDDRWLHIGDPEYDAYLREELESVNELLVPQGLTVVWLTAPTIEAGRSESPPPNPPHPESDPTRMARLNAMIEEMARARQGVVTVDLAGYVDALPPAEDERLRPDGVHFTDETSPEVATWLGPQILTAVAREPAPQPPGP